MDEDSVIPALLRAKMCRPKPQPKKKLLVCEILDPNILSQKTFMCSAPSHREVERKRNFALNKALQKVTNDYDARGGIR
ncbi:hypothetical protein GOV10_04040 [Candidatus Woesearchaeota archaeon]|nr:hypothetical protein [Candidatus Woesearchaeota archaeon]